MPHISCSVPTTPDEVQAEKYEKKITDIFILKFHVSIFCI